MKKFTIVVAIFALFCVFESNAQNPMPVGSAQINLGVGFSNWGVPFYAGFDYGIDRDFTLGAEFSYRAYNENWHNKDWNHTVMGFSGNANYHFNSLFKLQNKKIDIYAGINVGFFVWKSPDYYEGDHSSALGLGGQFGLRYYLSNSVGLNLEFGGGNSFSGGKLGLTFRL